MLPTRLLHRLRRLLRLRHPGQDLVEFGVILAAFALVGMAGLNVLGRAEVRYFIPLQNDLAPPAPVGNGDVVHAVDTGIACSQSLVVAGAVVDCTVTVVDRPGQPGTQHALTGQLDLRVDGAMVATCTIPNGNTTTCTLHWHTGPSDVNLNPPPHTLNGYYTPDPVADPYHSPSDPGPPHTATWPVVVHPQMVLNTSCTNPWHNSAGLPASWVEVGHPMECDVQVLDPLTSLPYSHQVTVFWMVTQATHPSQGHVTFSCFASHDYHNLGACGPLTSDLGWCVADPSHNESCAINFRRAFDDNNQVDIGTETLTATGILSNWATGITTPAQVVSASVPQNQHPTQIQVVRPSLLAGLHPVDVAVSCPGSTQNGTVLVRPSVGLNLSSVTAVTAHAGGTVTCTVVVFDKDPNQAFDSGSCSGGPGFCDPDLADAHTPRGVIQMVDGTVDQNNPAPLTNVTCELGHPFLRPTAASIATAGPGQVPLPAASQPEYASWCSVQVPLDGSIHLLGAEFEGEQSVMPFPAHSIDPSVVPSTMHHSLWITMTYS